MEPIQRYQHFEIRKNRQSTEVVPLTASFDESSFDELKSILALVFYQSSLHVKINLSGVKVLPLPVAMKILSFALDLRLKNRTLVLTGASPSFKKLIQFYRMDRSLLIF
ncbi:anti-sigma factor antagonist [Leptospira sp. 201903070]|uniref:Anti-sigma factor antagonist n=1 Tax=Leptospira ainlahdjerensis TaxID=2810033 RepID=A0ABS2UGK4_9LEPT|nr:anti-sigma factor antagonist [Leptospira ainlahdjerensis]MBM9578000.1 anti-sigma factor antagonist [Leptospira ainlahdjerensis]